ncbi:D-serine ammonia-lyase, partial [Sinorhizobium medicae]
LEPSAAAGFAGPGFIVKHPQGRAFCERLKLSDRLRQATHVVWTTGGSFVPQEQFDQFLEIAQASRSR